MDRSANVPPNREKLTSWRRRRDDEATTRRRRHDERNANTGPTPDPNYKREPFATHSGKRARSLDIRYDFFVWATAKLIYSSFFFPFVGFFVYSICQHKNCPTPIFLFQISRMCCRGSASPFASWPLRAVMLGFPGSGTTSMSWLLSSHPNISMVNRDPQGRRWAGSEMQAMNVLATWLCGCFQK